jgi:hypothetical protein
MTDLAAHGIEVTLPAGWEGRVFRRPAAGEVAVAEADGPPAPIGETTYAILHVSTIALPPGMGDFASGAVDKLGPSDALIVLFEYDPASADQPLFRSEGIPKDLAADDFSPGVLQRALRGQAGVQRFFHQGGRAFCLYVVLGAFANRRHVVPQVNEVLSTLTVDQLDATGTTTTTPPSTTAPDSTSTTATTTTGAPITTPPATDAPAVTPSSP